MATSDEPPSAGLAGSLSRGAWASPQAFDVVRRPPAPPFWNNGPPPPAAPPPSSNFLDLNAPFEEDPHPQHPHSNAQQPGGGGRVLPNFMDRSGPSGTEGAVSFLNGAAGKEIGSGGDGPQHSFIDTNMNTAPQQQQLPSGAGGADAGGDEASSVVVGVGGVRDQEQQPPSAGGGQDTGPFVDYLSQFSGGKKEGGGDFQQERERERDRSKLPPVLKEPGDFPDELLSLSSSYHKKKADQDAGRSGGAAGGAGGRGGAPPTDGPALFLASGRVQDGLNLQQQQPPTAVQQQQENNRSSSFKEPRVRPMVVNFGSQMLDEKGTFRDEREAQPQPGMGVGVGLGVEERSLFPPRNIGQINRVDPFYSMPANSFREERPLLMPLAPQGSARETLDLSNNLSFKEEKLGRMAPHAPHAHQTQAQAQAQAQNQHQNQHQNQQQQQQVRGLGLDPSKEVMSLSLKRPFEEGDASVEEYKRRRDEAVQQTSLYNSNNIGQQQQQQGGDGGDGGVGIGMGMKMGMGMGMEMNMGMGMGMGMGGLDDNSNAMEASHMRRRERAGAPGEEQQQQQQRFQQSGEPKMMMMHAADQGQGQGTSGGDDKPIVWPPVVVIENTRLSWDDERSKWKGLGIEDIRKSLKEVENLEYARVKCLFDMYGQKSSAFVIFPATYEGYFEAEALSDQLERSGKGKEQWMKVRPQDSNPRSLRGFSTPDLVSPDGQRILYGYLANPEDMKRADPHKNGLKWFSESFNEKVRKPAQQRLQMPL